MTLTLLLANPQGLDNGEPTQLRLDRHGAIIGRSPHADWSLPDGRNYISSIHCEIDYRDGAYVLIDKSTNGTFLNGSEQRMAGSHVLKEGDVISIGHYRVSVSGGAASRPAEAQAGASAVSAAGSMDAWAGWTTDPSRPVAAAVQASVEWNVARSGWEDRPPPAGSGWAADVGPGASVAAGWATPTEEGASGWGASSPAARSEWDGADETAALGSGAAYPAHRSPGVAGDDMRAPPARAARPSSPAEASDPYASSRALSPGGDVWGAAGANPVQPKASGWDDIAPARDMQPLDEGVGYDGPSTPISGRGPMAQHWAAPRVDAATLPVPGAGAADIWGAMAQSHAVDWSRGGFGDAASACTPAPEAQPSGPGEAWTVLLTAACVSADGFEAEPVEAAATAGELLKRLVAGLVVMIEARARAKAQLGAQSTMLELRGNNPIKFARSPENVLIQLLNPPKPGFMSAAEAVEDSFRELQAHQLATLQAMQAALRATLERFSPEAIRKRAEMRGVLARILPTARHATLWEAYEREFEGVAQGSDEAFMDIFAKAFKTAYEAAASQMKSQG